MWERMALASPPRLGQKSVYVVEDERELAEEVGAELRSRGYLVVVTGSPQSALDAARADQASVLVMDRMIEGVDSLALIELLRKEGGRTPILLMSGLSDVDERIKGLKSGGDDYLVKPFHMKELGARVDALARRLPDFARDAIAWRRYRNRSGRPSGLRGRPPPRSPAARIQAPRIFSATARRCRDAIDVAEGRLEFREYFANQRR